MHLRQIIIPCLLFFSLTNGNEESPPGDYVERRGRLLQEDQQEFLGSSMELNEHETQVNTILMSFKETELVKGPLSFFKRKSLMDNSEVFKLIEILPKGANLHSHLETSAPIDFFVNNITHWNNLYYCSDKGLQNMKFHFFQHVSKKENRCPLGQKWKNVRKFRKRHGQNSQAADQWFTSKLSMAHSKRSKKTKNNIDMLRSEKKVALASDLIKYVKVFKEVLYEILESHFNDNVMYLEIRACLSNIYHLNQDILSQPEVLEIFKNVIQHFKEDHPGFLGAKMIYAPSIIKTKPEFEEALSTAIEMQLAYPDVLGGFELGIQEEDEDLSLLKHFSKLVESKEKGLKVVYDASEAKIEDNVIDAILLNASRVTYDSSLSKHPNIRERFKENDIGIEMNPIADQVLAHLAVNGMNPMIHYFQKGFPVVVVSDNPGIWGAKPLSHDWYIAFMGIAGKNADLRLLKQLAMNSIKYSLMSAEEKEEAFASWAKQWDEFLMIVIKNHTDARLAAMNKGRAVFSEG